MKKIILTAIAGIIPLVYAAAQEFQLKSEKELPIYECGKPASFTLSVLKDGKPLTEGKYIAEVTLDNNTVIEKKELDLAKGNPASFAATLKTPGFMLVRLRDAKGGNVTMPGKGNRRTPVLAGAAFEPEKIKMGYPLPADFMEFWEAGRKQLADKPVKLEKVEKKCTKTYTAYYVTVNSLNGETLTGYLSVPVGKGPFPAYITVPGAGPGGTGPAYDFAGKGVITLMMNVHKFPTADNPAEQKKRYQEYLQKNGTNGKALYYPQLGADSRDTYFFRSVYVGIDRVINHIAQMPEWDRRHMVVSGSSQGGGSALILAGLNKNITALAANVPALCDHAGSKKGRSSGWPRLDRTKNADKVAPYFDAANFARLIKVPALVSCGFIDRTCSPSSVYAAYNELGGEKEMVHMPLEGHTVSKAYIEKHKQFAYKHLGIQK